MEKSRVLYQIKSLDKMIMRYFLCNIENHIDMDVIKPFLTPTQMQIIEYILEHHEEEIYQKDLEDVLNLRRATVSGVLQTMEKNGLLERVVYSEDARTKKIILNDKAKEIFMMRQKELETLEDLMTRGIDVKELDIFSKVLDQMKENINNIK